MSEQGRRELFWARYQGLVANVRKWADAAAEEAKHEHDVNCMDREGPDCGHDPYKGRHQSYAYRRVLKELERLAAATRPPQELVSLREEFKAKADRAYCDYVDQLNRESCLGYEAKLRARKFGHQELDAHKRAAELYGKHLAFTEARAALTRGAVGGTK